MPTTTNYGWTTPADTDLVKDGASAIRTLGTAIDTTTKNLNPSTTLGDIEYRSSTANTNTRLAIGTAGQVLTVNSGATAPEWKTPASGALVHISTTAFSDVATQDFSAVFSATYKSYLVVINNLSAATQADDFQIQFRYGTSVQSTGYYGYSNYSTSGGATAIDATSGAAQFTIANRTGASSIPSGGFFYCYNMASATGYASINGQFNAYALDGAHFTGYCYAAQTFNGFRLKSSSSNITGNVSIYGLANA